MYLSTRQYSLFCHLCSILTPYAVTNLSQDFSLLLCHNRKKLKKSQCTPLFMNAYTMRGNHKCTNMYAIIMFVVVVVFFFLVSIFPFRSVFIITVESALTATLGYNSHLSTTGTFFILSDGPYIHSSFTSLPWPQWAKVHPK